MQEHFSDNDPRFVRSGEVRSVHNFVCITCGKSVAKYGQDSPYCDTCLSYSMKEESIIQDTKVAEIKSRKAAPMDENKRVKGRGGRYEDGMVQEIKAVIHPRQGKGDMLLSINMDKNMFLKGQIHVTWQDRSFLSSVYEFSNAFAPFDPSPREIMIETATEVTTQKIVPPMKKGKTKIGPITVIGAENMQKYKDTLVDFVAGDSRATFNMADIAQVIQYAL